MPRALRQWKICWRRQGQRGQRRQRQRSVQGALRVAQEIAAGGVVVVSGSVYLVGEARAMLLGEIAAGESETR